MNSLESENHEKDLDMIICSNLKVANQWKLKIELKRYDYKNVILFIRARRL